MLKKVINQKIIDFRINFTNKNNIILVHLSYNSYEEKYYLDFNYFKNVCNSNLCVDNYELVFKAQALVIKRCFGDLHI